MTKGGKRSPACSFSQLGVALCPCDGSVSDETYQQVVDQLRRGVEICPPELLDPLVGRIRDYARTSRFEEAAELRDRHRALARALDDRRNWEVLQHAGLLWAEDDAESVLIENGRLVASWTHGDQPPLSTTAVANESPHHVPDTVATAEEARLIWKWLSRPGVRIVESGNPLATSRYPVPALTTLAG
jgi:DNA polymerase-3 subunit epsilon